MKEIKFYKDGELVKKKFRSVEKANKYLNKKGICEAYYNGTLFVLV